MILHKKGVDILKRIEIWFILTSLINISANQGHIFKLPLAYSFCFIYQLTVPGFLFILIQNHS